MTIQRDGLLEPLPEDVEAREEIVDLILDPTMPKRGATFADVAVFAASDSAASMTGRSFTIACDTTVD